MKPARKQLLILLMMGLSLMTVQVAQADDCAAYEAEMEAYFLNESAQIEPDKVEQIWRSCNEPTDKMKLIYHYFKAETALSYYARQPHRAYQLANYYYDRAAQYFNLLVDPAKSRDPFAQAFFKRANQFERRMTSMGQKMGYRGIYRSQTATQGQWAKELPPVKEQSELAQTRGAGRREASFAKTFYYDGAYVDEHTENKRVVPRSTEEGEENEAYGFVGHLENLAFMDYLSWLEEVESLPASPYDDAGMWIDNLGENYQGGVSVMRNLVITDAPGANAKEAYKVGFGQMVARDLAVSPIFEDGSVYIKVRDELGRDGWAVRDLVVPGGRLAVVVDNTIAFTIWHDRRDLNAVHLKPGQLVILADVKSDEKEDWIQVVTEDKTSQGWVEGIDDLSIEPEDIFFARELEIALNIPSPEARFTYLQQLKQLPEYFSTALAPVIDKELAQIRR